MKLVLTVAAFLFISTVYSQDKQADQKVATIKKGIVIESDTFVRVYRRKNSEIKKELHFITKRSTLIA